MLTASEHSVGYTCGRCSTVVLHADEGQVHGILIRCTNCGTYNSMKALAASIWRRLFISNQACAMSAFGTKRT